MFRAGKWAVALTVVASAALWAGPFVVAQDTKPDAKAKSADLTALREAVTTAAKRGENVDEIKTALDALEKALPTAAAGSVPAELQALRDAVDAAGRKGENVEAITKELLAVEMTVAGKSLAKPKPEPVRPNPDPFRPNPVRPLVPFPQPFPIMPNPRIGGGGVDVEMFNKAMELRRKALEMMVKNPNDAEMRKEMQKLLAEANQMMLKAAGGGAGGGVDPIVPAFPLPAFPEFGRVPDRARLGIRLERVAPVAAEQLGLDAGVGIAVTLVTPGSVAEKAGLKVHDIIIEFGGKPVTDNTEDFIRRVNAVGKGEKVNIVVLRKGKKVEMKDLELPLIAAPQQPAFPLPGLLPEVPNGRPIFPADPLPLLPNVVPLQPLPAPIPPPLPVPVPIPPVRDELPLDVRAAADVNLDDLKDAVTAANKRGENVGSISDALKALEKAMAKGAKAGEAPPELTALRDAVEAAAKKGENVELISKELGKVEKALTGREFERPKPVEPPRPMLPEPPPFRGGRGGIVINGGNRIVIGGAGGNFNSTSVSISGGMFTVKARQGEVTYTITGSTNGTEAPKIIIKDGDKTTETDDIKKVPEAHRPAVERLLGMVRRG